MAMLSRTPSALSRPTSDDEWEEVEEVEEVDDVEAGMATVTMVSKVEVGIAKVITASWENAVRTLPEGCCTSL